MANETATFRDFSRKRPRIFFAIGDDEFDAYKALTPAKLQEAMHKFKGTKEEDGEVNVDNIMEKLAGALGLLLKPESFTRFVAAMNDEERDEPIDVPQLTDIFQWLIEQYTSRPTQALDDSSTSSKIDSAGTDSLDGAQQLELIPSN